MGKKSETRRNSRREMGEKWETRRNSRREMGLNGKRDDTRYIIFQQKREKQGEKLKNRRKNTKKQEKTGEKQEKTEIYKKYGNEISTRFPEMLKTETSFWRDFGKC